MEKIVYNNNRNYTGRVFSVIKKTIFKLVRLSVLLFLFLLGYSSLAAQSTEKSETEGQAEIPELEARFYSVDSFGSGAYQHVRSLDENQGVLTMEISHSSVSGIPPEELAEWFGSDLLEAGGIRFLSETIRVTHGRTVQLLFELDESNREDHESGYVETVLNFNESYKVRYHGEGVPVAFFSKMNTVLHVEIKGVSRRIFTTDRYQAIAAKNRMSNPTATSQRYPGAYPSFLIMPKSEEKSDVKRSFVYRNRYWLMGASALAGGSAAFLITGSDNSPAYLPVPPGRP